MYHLQLCLSLGVQGLADDIGRNISSLSKMFPLQSCLSNFTIFISHTHAKIEDHYPEIDQMDFYRYVIQPNRYRSALQTSESVSFHLSAES